MANSQDQPMSSRQQTATTVLPKQEGTSIVEFKNGKAHLRQKLLPLEKLSETMQEIVKLRDCLESKINEGASAFDKFPDEHLPLLAKLVQESEKTAYVLSKHIHEALKPLGEETSASHDDTAVTFSSVLPLPVVELAINAIAKRVNYGLDVAGKVPASLSIWRWEVNENHRDWLPASVQNKLQARKLERQQAKNDLGRIFEALPTSEQELLLKPNKKLKTDSPGVIVFSTSRSGLDENTPMDNVLVSSNHEGTSGLTESPGKKEKVLDPEKIAKEKEKAEKKAAKVEKERKDKEAQNKSRNIMSNFFKPKTISSKTSPLRHASSGGASSSSTDAIQLSDFDRTFKPFIVKKDASVAPINSFVDRRKGKEVIVIDSDETQSSAVASSSKLRPDCPSVASFEGILSEARSKRHLKKRKTSNMKSTSRHCVRDLIAQLTEAEVIGDDITVRRILSLLESREEIVAKVLIFHEDTRPGYFGTFTKSSSVVGPRTPFAKDAVAFDYGYDSGAEWEEEEAGDDLVSLDGSLAESDEDSEMDDWLVDDEDNAEPATPLDEREGSPAPFLPSEHSPSTGKRKSSEAPDKKRTKKRKVLPLVPFVKGPSYEARIGECDFEPFKEYRIQLFNDTPFPIDPFTFVSSPYIEHRQSPTKDGFVVPALPLHIQLEQKKHETTKPLEFVSMQVDFPACSSTSSGGALASPSSSSLTKRKAANTNLPPKSPFPDSLLPLLAEKIEKLAASSLTWIIENLYQDLKAHKVKKNAIEAKVREVVEKCPVQKIWKVKEDVLRSLAAPVA